MNQEGDIRVFNLADFPAHIVWYAADVEGAATALFITAGAGTQIRPH